MKNTTFFFTLALSLAVFAAAPPALADDWRGNRRFQSIDPPGSIDTRAFGINAQGEIVGLYVTPDDRTHGFIFRKGRYSTIDIPDAIRTNALDINAHGQIVGRYDDPAGAHGYVLSKGVLVTIDAPDAAGFTVVTDIDEFGNMAGRYRSADGRFHGFTLVDGTFTTIDYPGAIGIQGIAINEAGIVAGYYVDVNQRFHGFLLEDGVYTTLDPPGAISTGSSGGILKINPAGVVVGKYALATDSLLPCGCQGHGFIYRKGVFKSFDYPGAVATINTGVNPRGDVVGIFVDTSNRLHGFLAPKAAARRKD